MSESNTFDNLVKNIIDVDKNFGNVGKKAINRAMTLRNWLIGYYIVEFEQNGFDRAGYGTNLLKEIERRTKGIKGLNATLYRYCRRFYRLYPEVGSIVKKTYSLPILHESIQTTALSKLDSEEKEIQTTPLTKFRMDPDVLVDSLSFSHIKEIMTVDDPLARFFYELECIKCNWSVRELDRQISSQLYFRVGISKNPEALLTETVCDEAKPILTIKDPFVFEFLGLDTKETVSESNLEQALMDHLQEFLLEMGNGFCFEARQKRIVIDDEYYTLI